MKNIWLLLVFLCPPAMAQDNGRHILFKDAIKTDPLSHVVVYQVSGQVVAESDRKGNAFIPDEAISGQKILLVARYDYKTDTIYTAKMPASFYMHELSVLLKEAVISNKNLRRISRDARQYVVDYDFTDDGNIVVATYGYKEPRLMLLNRQGTTLYEMPLTYAADELYCSCTGKHYMVINDGVYPLTLDGNTITRDAAAYDKDFLARLRNCQLTTGNSYFYRFVNDEDLYVSYEMRTAGADSNRIVLELYDIPTLIESNTALAKINGDLSQYIFLNSTLHQGIAGDAKDYAKIKQGFMRGAGGSSAGNFDESSGRTYLRSAGQKARSRYVFDRNFMKKLVSPAYTDGNGVVIFDLFYEKIRFYDTAGNALDSLALLPEIVEKTEVTVLKDEVTGHFYMHRTPLLKAQTIQEIDMTTGRLKGAAVTLEKQLAEKVRVRDGLIYYLWQDNGVTGVTQQLFVQKAF